MEKNSSLRPSDLISAKDTSNTRFLASPLCKVENMNIYRKVLCHHVEPEKIPEF